MLPTAGPRRIDYLVGSACLLFVAALGALHLDYPFVPDQFLALLGARQLAAGGTLYVDFWDNKMPALFWFYELAGHLFSFDEAGVHKLELLWMLGFAATLIVTLRDYLSYPWMSGLAAVAVVGVYYASAEAFHLTQIEILVAFPLYICAWLASRRYPSGRAQAAAFLLLGVMAGVVASFKLLLAPIAGVFCLLALAQAHVVDGTSAAAACRRIALPAVFGLGVVLLGVVLIFAGQDALSALLWTAFEYPRSALGSAPAAPLLRLGMSSLFVVAFYFSWAFFVALAVHDWWTRERHVMTGLLLAWLVTAALIIVLQRFSWWSYHVQLLFTPAGLLGVRGLGLLPRRLESEGAIDARTARVLLAALAFPALGALAIPLEQKLGVLHEVYVLEKGGAADLRRKLVPQYAYVERSVRFLGTSSARPGPIYVFGEPNYYILSGRTPALPVPGWAWQFFLQSQWEQLPTQLAQALPAYVYVDSLAVKIMASRGGGVREYLNATYVPFTRDHNGTWYQVRPDLWRARHPAR